jgi:type IV pilus assembly protein PilX
MKNSKAARKAERGMVLVSSLLLLIVVTIIALSMFRSFGIQEKIAGNMREKQRALSAAVSAQQFAENWLMANATSAPVDCVAGVLNGNAGFGQICSNATKLSTMVGDVTNVPWTIGGAPVGVSFLPTGMLLSDTPSVSAGVTNPTYYSADGTQGPTFYISDMGASFDPNIPGEIYMVDAYGYGGTATTVAVVESTYAVYTTSSSPTI